MQKAVLVRIRGTMALAATLLVNALANLLPINGLTTGDVANRYPSLFTPAGFTFSIWSIIYCLLIGFLIYCWVRRKDQKIGALLLWFILSCVLNIAWILAWHNLLPLLSVVVMIMLLLTLTRIFIFVQENFPHSREHMLVRLPFTIYFAWICVATIANIAAYLTSLGWSGFFLSPEIWTVIMLTMAGILALRIFLLYETTFVIVVILWTFAGIYFRWRGSEYDILLRSIPVLSLVLLVVSVLKLLKRKTT
jgi:translocator protein